MNTPKQQKIDRLFRLMEHSEEENGLDREQGLKTLKALVKQHVDINRYPDHPEKRCEIQAQLEAGAPLTGEKGLRKALAAFDLSFFGRAYFPHYFSKPSPNFHLELDELWENGVLKGLDPLEDPRQINLLPGCHKAVAAPRGHAKSTNLTFKDNLHAILYRYKHYLLILSDVREQATGFLEAISEELEENQAVKEDFGDLMGGVWREDVIVTKTGIKIQAKGAGQKVRGLKHKNWRPDLITLDDIENDENVRTPEQREKLRGWYYKAVSKCGDVYTDFVYIGTVLHYDSLLINVMNNQAYDSVKYQAVLAFSACPLWTAWEELLTDRSNKLAREDALRFFREHEALMLAGTEVLWPEKLSYYDLMFMRVTEGTAAFNSEEQNEPIDPADCIFNADRFDYYNPHEVDFQSKDFEFYGFVDPSLGKSKSSDFSAIITLAKQSSTGYLFVADADIERRLPSAIIEAVLGKAVWIKKAFGKKYVSFGCETNQFQYFLKTELAKESARRGIYLPVREVQQTTDKVLRVQTLQPDIENKYLKFNRQHSRLLEQLQYFPMADHDDGPDGLEGCRTLACGGNRRRIRIGKRRFGL